MTVGATVTAGVAGPLAIPLAAVDPTNPFRRQDLAAGTGSDPPQYFNGTVTAYAAPVVPPSCFSAGLPNPARLFEIDRYRFHVRPVAAGGFPGGKTKYDPYLVLDTGTDTNLDGVIDDQDELLIAEGVEIMQVAYTLSNAALPRPTVGITPGVPIALTPGLPGSMTVADELTLTARSGVPVPASLPLTFTYAPTLQPADNPYAVTSWYSYPAAAANPAFDPRLTDGQANIRSVRVALVGRSPEPDTREAASLVLDNTFRLYNLNAVPAWIAANAYPSANDGYQRVQLESNILVPNMNVRGMTYF
jgi:type IV pilus assembly protein PilW